MNNPLDTISKITGLKRAEMDAIFQQVKANHAKLESCARHDFSIPVDHLTKQPIPAPAVLCYWECRHCHGQVGALEKNWYERGLQQANSRL